MNIAYYRKSNFDFQTTLKNLKTQIEKNKLKLLSEVELNDSQGIILNVCHQDWISGFLSQDKNLIGLLPCAIALIKKDNEVLVGSGDPNLIGKLTDNPQIVTIAKQAENTLKNIINEAAGVGPLKVKEIKLYATMSCPYCKMEASWLDENKVKYRHIFVDLDQRAAEEMVRKTGQMGVPVTEIVYDNDEQEYIIGFDKERLEEILLKN
jgi:glutaredoxin/uncharacterized protein (DUF302 family)